MNIEEKQLHLNNISMNLTEIEKLTTGMDFNKFIQEEDVKERVYTSLQTAAQAANQVADYIDDPKLNVDLKVLTEFQNARYNQVAEMDHSPVWNLIQTDLPLIRDEVLRTAENLE